MCVYPKRYRTEVRPDRTFHHMSETEKEGIDVCEPREIQFIGSKIVSNVRSGIG